MKSNSAVVWKYISNVSQCWTKSRLGRQRGCGSPSSTERFSWDKLVWATQTNLKPTFFRFDRFEIAIFLYFDRLDTVIFFRFLTDLKPASFFYNI